MRHVVAEPDEDKPEALTFAVAVWPATLSASFFARSTFHMDGLTQRSARAAGSSMGDEESASRMTQETASTPGAWKTDRVGIRKADNGGFIVDCSRSRDASGGSKSQTDAPGVGNDTYQNKDYAFSTLEEVVGFIGKEFGGSAAAPAGDAGEGEY